MAAIEDAGVRTVYHVQVAAGRGIIVGARGILAHDERVAFPAAVAVRCGGRLDEHRPATESAKTMRPVMSTPLRPRYRR